MNNFFEQKKVLNKEQSQIFINKKVWDSFTSEEMEDFIEKSFNYYRKNGFPYFNLSKSELQSNFIKLKNFDSSTLREEDNVLKQVMLGLNIANYFMKHIWNTKCRGFITPIDCFYDDKLLRKAIKKVVQLGENMSDAGLRKSLSWTQGTHKVSNFRPTIAKYIYDNYSGGGEVLDFSAGYGGRLLGAMTSKNVNSYTGVDPNLDTIEQLKVISHTFKHKCKVDLINKPFEDIEFTHKYDLIFSSPPYYNTEEYSYNETQSFMRYTTKEEWKHSFLEYLIDKAYMLLKDNGYFIINIANVRSYKTLEEDTLELAKEAGFKLIKTYKMSLSSLMGKGFKYEPIFVFSK